VVRISGYGVMGRARGKKQNNKGEKREEEGAPPGNKQISDRKGNTSKRKATGKVTEVGTPESGSVKRGKNSFPRRITGEDKIRIVKQMIFWGL